MRSEQLDKVHFSFFLEQLQPKNLHRSIGRELIIENGKFRFEAFNEF